MATKIKKMQDGGRPISEKRANKKFLKDKGYIVENTSGTGSSYVPFSKAQKKATSSPATVDETMKSSKTARPIKTPKMKTGGMVNPNAKMQADKTAGSKGVKSGVNPKAAASKVAKGRSGGTSAAPKTALPKAQMGKIVKMTSKVAKAAGKGAKKASGSVLDFRKAATKSDMSKAFSNIERANLKKQLQDLEKAKKG